LSKNRPNAPSRTRPAALADGRVEEAAKV
jgi:hypothetical protein